MIFCCYKYLTRSITGGDTLQTCLLCFRKLGSKVRASTLQVAPRRVAGQTFKGQIAGVCSLVRHNPLLIGPVNGVTNGKTIRIRELIGNRADHFDRCTRIVRTGSGRIDRTGDTLGISIYGGRSQNVVAGATLILQAIPLMVGICLDHLDQSRIQTAARSADRAAARSTLHNRLFQISKVCGDVAGVQEVQRGVGIPLGRICSGYIGAGDTGRVGSNGRLSGNVVQSTGKSILQPIVVVHQTIRVLHLRQRIVQVLCRSTTGTIADTQNSRLGQDREFGRRIVPSSCTKVRSQFA